MKIISIQPTKSLTLICFVSKFIHEKGSINMTLSRNFPKAHLCSYLTRFQYKTDVDHIIYFYLYSLTSKGEFSVLTLKKFRKRDVFIILFLNFFLIQSGIIFRSLYFIITYEIQQVSLGKLYFIFHYPFLYCQVFRD